MFFSTRVSIFGQNLIQSDRNWNKSAVWITEPMNVWLLVGATTLHLLASWQEVHQCNQAGTVCIPAALEATPVPLALVNLGGARVVAPQALATQFGGTPLGTGSHPDIRVPLGDVHQALAELSVPEHL